MLLHEQATVELINHLLEEQAKAEEVKRQCELAAALNHEINAINKPTGPSHKISNIKFFYNLKKVNTALHLIMLILFGPST